jgi:hypothetical protein
MTNWGNTAALRKEALRRIVLDWDCTQNEQSETTSSNFGTEEKHRDVSFRVAMDGPEVFLLTEIQTDPLPGGVASGGAATAEGRGLRVFAHEPRSGAGITNRLWEIEDLQALLD